MEDWQSWAAGSIVFLTIVVLVFRALRGQKKGCGSCGPHGCATGQSGKES